MKKFKKLYLHIGQEKTGTTSIQRALDTHRDQLEVRGYLYPKTIAVGKNILLGAMFSASASEKPLFQAVIEKRGGSHKDFVKTVQAELAEEYKNTDAEDLILSSEFIAAHTQIDKVKAYCDSIAEETEVVLYIREQASLIMSLYSTFVKGGGTLFGTLKQLEEKRLPEMFNYRKMIENISAYFPDQLTLKVFERDSLRAGNIINDFLEIVGLAAHEDEFQIPRQNESLSIVGVEVLKAINVHMPIVVDGQKNMARTALVNDVMAIDANRHHDKPALTTEQIKLIEKICKTDNKWVRDNYFPKRKTLFEPVKISKKSDIKTEDVMDHAAELITAAYTKLWERQNLLNETAPMIKTMQNKVNRSIPKLNVVDRRISRTTPLVSSIQEKIAQTRPMLEALSSSAEKTEPLASALQQGMKPSEKAIGDIQTKIDQASPMIKSISEKIDQSSPLIDAAHEKISQTPDMLSSVHEKLEQSRPMFESLRAKISQSSPLLDSAHEKIVQTPPMLQAIQEKLDQTLPMINAIQEKLNQTLPLIKSMQDKIDNSVPMLTAVQGKMDNTLPILESIQSKVDASLPVLNSANEKIKNAVPMLEAVQEKIGKTGPVLASVQSKITNSLPMIGNLQIKLGNPDPKLSAIMGRLNKQSPTIFAIIDKLDKISPMLEAIQDNIDHASPNVAEIQENLDNTGPELNAMHTKLSAHRSPDE